MGEVGLTGRQRLLGVGVGNRDNGQRLLIPDVFSHPAIHVDLSTLRIRGSMALVMGPVGHTERKRNLCVSQRQGKHGIDVQGAAAILSHISLTWAGFYSHIVKE